MLFFGNRKFSSETEGEQASEISEESIEKDEKPGSFESINYRNETASESNNSQSSLRNEIVSPIYDANTLEEVIGAVHRNVSQMNLAELGIGLKYIGYNA